MRNLLALLFFLFSPLAAASAQQAINGVPNQSMSLPGLIPEYDINGNPVSSYSCTLLTGTSTANGTFTINYTANPVWTTPSSVFVANASVLSSGAAASQSYVIYPTSVSSTSVSGYVKSGTTLSILGATIIAGTVAEPITIEICGW